MSALDNIATSFWAVEDNIRSCIDKLPAASSECDLTSEEEAEVLDAFEDVKNKFDDLHERVNEILNGHSVPIPASGGGNKT